MPAVTIDLRPQEVNVKVRRGDKWNYLVQFKPGGVVTDITGWEVKASKRTAVDATPETPLLITPADWTTGQFYVGENAAGGGVFVYDLQITPTGGLPRTYISGEIEADPDITT